MDTASSGPVQLRADARHLDVGIQSAALGWVEVRATTAASGRVEASLHVESAVSANALASQAGDIANYAREQSIHMGQVSVGVGTGDGARQQPQSSEQGGAQTESNPDAEPTAVASDEMYRTGDILSLISIRA